MKKLILATVVLFSVMIVLHSCKKESDGPKVAFTHSTMKPWFDTNCAGCHANGAANAGSWLYDPTDYEGSIQTHLSHINEQVINGAMPLPPQSLTSQELQDFNNWYLAGGPASN